MGDCRLYDVTTCKPLATSGYMTSPHVNHWWLQAIWRHHNYVAYSVGKCRWLDSCLLSTPRVNCEQMFVTITFSLCITLCTVGTNVNGYISLYIVTWNIVRTNVMIPIHVTSPHEKEGQMWTIHANVTSSHGWYGQMCEFPVQNYSSLYIIAWTIRINVDDCGSRYITTWTMRTNVHHYSSRSMTTWAIRTVVVTVNATLPHRQG